MHLVGGTDVEAQLVPRSIEPMSVIADFSVPAEEFVLGELLEVRKGVKLRLESMIPTGDSVIPYFWVRSPDVAAVESTLRESALVESVKVLDEVGDETLFRVEWRQDLDGVIDTINRTDAVILEGEGHGDHWSFKMRFPDTASLSRFYQETVDHDIAIGIDRVHDPIDADRLTDYGLTAEQREALALALEEGYFAVPRETTLVDLAEALDISDSAVSQRLRRGLTKILAASIDSDAAG